MIYLQNFIVELIFTLGKSIESIVSDYQLFIQTMIIVIGAVTLTNLAGISFLLILINSNTISDFLETLGSQLITSIEVLSLSIIELGQEALGLVDDSFWFLIKIFEYLSLALIDLGRSTLGLLGQSFLLFLNVLVNLSSAIFQFGRSSLIFFDRSFYFFIKFFEPLFESIFDFGRIQLTN